jgi:hypothetical protein
MNLVGQSFPTNTYQGQIQGELTRFLVFRMTIAIVGPIPTFGIETAEQIGHRRSTVKKPPADTTGLNSRHNCPPKLHATGSG